MDTTTVLKADSSLISHQLGQRHRLGCRLAFPLCLALSLHPGLSFPISAALLCSPADSMALYLPPPHLVFFSYPPHTACIFSLKWLPFPLTFPGPRGSLVPAHCASPRSLNYVSQVAACPTCLLRHLFSLRGSAAPTFFSILFFFP